MLPDASILEALNSALTEAEAHRGATAPNPPVGAAALDAEGRILSVQAHLKAGTPHAEARVIDDCYTRGLLEKIDTLVVTLEPCNHQGRTPPCTEAILGAGIRRVSYAISDPNPKVVGRGGEYLREKGCEVVNLSERFAGAPVIARAKTLIAPYTKWVTTGLPWVTVKQALDLHGSMIPPRGAKTFTRTSSLQLAHELRKRADAIITGSGTVLADWPEFTVRHVTDHPGKRRALIILDRSRRVPDTYLHRAEASGFDVSIEDDLQGALVRLGAQGCHEVLVEAGPRLLPFIFAQGCWDTHVIMRYGQLEDEVTILTNDFKRTIPDIQPS